MRANVQQRGMNFRRSPGWTKFTIRFIFSAIAAGVVAALAEKALGEPLARGLVMTESERWYLRLLIGVVSGLWASIFFKLED